MVARIEPVAVTRGQTVEVVIGGAQSFAGASVLLVEPPGLVGEVIGEINGDGQAAKRRRKGPRKPNVSIKGTLTVAADAPLGPREIRVGTPQGVSSVGLVVVVDDPVVPEADDQANNRPEAAQSLSFPSVIAGKISVAEDVDWYAFDGKAGQDVVFVVWANRLENKIHDLQTHFDPILSIQDSQGRELQAADNHFYADPLLSYRLPETGRYYLQIRDTTYAGNPSWTYALRATTGPVATSVVPLAVNPGGAAKLKAVGVNFDNQQMMTFDVPNGLNPGIAYFSLPAAEGKTLPVPLMVTPLPVVLEQGDAAKEAAEAQAITLPAAVSGRLDAPRGIDVYSF